MARKYHVAARKGGQTAMFAFPTLAKAKHFAFYARREGYECIIGKPAPKRRKTSKR